MKHTRRRALKHLVMGLLPLLGVRNPANAMPKDSKATPMTEVERKQQKYDAMMKAAMKEDEKQVEQLYSTKPTKVILGKREYVIPANYFGPKQKNEVDVFRASDERGFGFFLFLPDYGGYTKENWRDPFDPRRITVVEVKPVVKNEIGIFTDGTRRPLSPDRFDPRQRFERRKSSLEDIPSFKLYGLEGYRSKGGGSSTVTWAGKRSNEEFFFFTSSLAPGEPKKPGITNPLCDVRYYSDKEDLSIVYRYSQQHIAQWREIDDAIWAKLHEWQVK